MTGPPLFAAEAFARRFGKRQILTHASAWVWPSGVSALIGRNGCGKSTLIRIATGLLRGQNGTVIFEDYRSSRPSLAHLANRGLFYWPDLELLPVGRTVEQLFAALRHHVPDAAVDAAVDGVRLEEMLRQTTHTLSGGERRRVELGLAVARRPRCLLADEPFRGVAPADHEGLVTAFRRLAEGGCGVLVTGHEVDTLLDLADHVIWMTSGTTHHLGAPDAARQHDQFRREYLGR